MSIDPHVLGQLSAHLDRALGPVERAAVDAHLASCPACRARLAELRGTAALLASLPELVPGRRLAPRIARPSPWLAPLRTLSTLASGVSVFLFIASALLSNIGFLAAGQATSLSAPAAAPAPAASSREDTTASSTARAAAPDAAKQAASAAPSAATGFSANATQPPADAARGAQGGASDQAARTVASAPRAALGPSPWLWLALAVVTGAIAIALQRRLRSA